MTLPPLLHEDDAVLAFAKTGGEPTTAGLIHAIQARHGKTVAPAHRPEPETSGVWLFAKDKPSLDAISGQFQSKTVTLVAHGLAYVLPAAELDPPETLRARAGVAAPLRDASGLLPDNFTVELCVGEHEDHAGRMTTYRKRGGKPALTTFRLLERFHDRNSRALVWVEASHSTARGHQVRLHLAASGAPLLADPLYGVPGALLLSGLKRGYKGRDGERPLLDRLALHHSSLTLRHPATREPLTLTAPLPHDLELALKNLRKFAA
jgi:23S rRNA-/tRNA-specific pseudouridylate synthase